MRAAGISKVLLYKTLLADGEISIGRDINPHKDQPKTKGGIMKTVTVFLLTLLLALGASGFHPAFAQQDSYKKFENVEEMLDDYESLLGTKISVPGEVEYRIDSRSFVLESGGIINDEIVVVMPSDFPENQASIIVEDADLMVRGTLKSFSVIEIERELDWDWSPEIEAELENVLVIIEAAEIEPR